MTKAGFSDSKPPLPLITVQRKLQSDSGTGTTATIRLVLITAGPVTVLSAEKKRILTGNYLCVVPERINACFQFDRKSPLTEIAVDPGFYHRCRGHLNGDGSDIIRDCYIEQEDSSFPLLFPLEGELFFRIRELFADMLREHNRGIRGFESMLTMQFCELLILLQRLISVRSPEPSSSSPPRHASWKPVVWEMRDVIRYVDNHYSEHLTLGEMASRCALNPSYFSRAFREAAGKPLFEYLNTIRIRKACSLLQRTEMTILDIAYSVGYNNVSFFNRYFKKIMNISPREYRKISKSRLSK